MKERERQSCIAEDSKRAGFWGTVELGDDRRRMIYEDDAEGLRRVREKEREGKERMRLDKDKGFQHVERYSMVAKRIW